MDFKQLIAKYVSGNLSTEQLPEVACKGLEEGYDSPSLIILAGIDKNENFYVIDKYFKSTLAELNIPIPNVRLAVLQYACAIVDEIIEGKKDAFWGIMEIKSKALDRYDFSSEIKKYVYDSIFFEEVYGVFVQYDDLISEWVEGKSDPDLVANIKIEMFVALKKWREKMNAYI